MTIISRDKRPEKLKTLNDTIRNIHPSKYLCTNVDNSFYNLHQELLKAIDKICPEKEITIPEKFII